MKKYNRVLLKLSGESLAGANKQGIDENKLFEYVGQVKEISERGVGVAIVIGGGNIFRGLGGAAKGIDRVKGDYMGMLATIINGLALQSGFESANQDCVLLTSFSTAPVGERYSKDKADNYLKKGRVVILAGGSGNPYFTTDTAAALRAVEIEADILLKGTRVDGVYNADPEKNPDAVKFHTVTFDEVYEKGLKIMDLTAFTMCMENNMPIYVFDMDTPGNLRKVIEGEEIGTIIRK